MIRDALLCFSGIPSSTTPAPTTIIPASATTTIMPESIDTAPLGLPTGSGGGSTSLPNAGRDLGIGGEMWIQVLLATVAASSSGTWQCQLITDSGATLGSAVVLLSFRLFLSNAMMIAAFGVWTYFGLVAHSVAGWKFQSWWRRRRGLQRVHRSTASRGFGWIYNRNRVC